MTSGRVLRDAYYGRGCIYHKKGRYDDALRDFSSATDVDETFADGYAMSGWGHFEKVVSRAEKHMDIDTDSFFGKLGAIWNGLSMGGNMIVTIAALDTALNLEPRNAIALMVHGKISLAAVEEGGTVENAREALQYFQKALSSDPSLREAREGQVQAEQVIKRLTKKWWQ